jgi:cytoskeleton protein RodZ
MDASGALHYQTEGSDAPGVSTHGIGDTFRAARLRASLSIADVAAATKISVEYLEAIESMDRAALPQRAYALGFVRCYANHMGLNAEEMVCGFKTQFYNDVSPLGDLSPRPAPAWVDFRLPKGTGIMLVIACALGLATWYGLRTPAQSVAAIPPVPEALAGWASSDKLGDVPDISITYVTLSSEPK